MFKLTHISSIFTYSYFYNILRTAIVIIFFVLMALPDSHGVSAPIVKAKPDMLAYVSESNDLMLYDPRARTQFTLLQKVDSFVLASNGNVAFTRLDNNDHNLNLFDPSKPESSRTTVISNSEASSIPISWSPDGHYLALASYQKDAASLYIWDGKEMHDITPHDSLGQAQQFYPTWSSKGQLAFTVIYGWSSVSTPSEIYIWDGTGTRNLSQNPKGEDYAVGWSASGKLMFESHQNDAYLIYVWDGVSFKDGLPNAATFARVAPALKLLNARWTDDGLIAMAVESDSATGRNEILLYDLDSKSVIKKYRVSSKKPNSWLATGDNVILSSILASGIPSVYLDVEDTTGKLLFSIHTGEYSWSGSGYLAYCGIDGSLSRLLSIWDGVESWLVARVSYKPVQWQNGKHIFSCNNG